MAKVFLRPHFQKDLSALKTNHRQNYRKVCEVIMDLETGAQVALPRRPEPRIPSCAKYELSEGHRVVFQEVAGTQTLVALCVGKDDHVDAPLKTGRNRGDSLYTVQCWDAKTEIPIYMRVSVKFMGHVFGKSQIKRGRRHVQRL